MHPQHAQPSTGATDDSGRIGDYALVRRIGSGGMGEIWLGRHVVTGTLGAVKRVVVRGRNPRLMSEYFAREARAVARLGHPHVVPLLEIGQDHLVTAYVEGGDLARHMQTPMPPADALRIARQVADALVHAHARGVIHRDVKPSNVLIDANGNAYLTDFGLAALGDEDQTPAAGTPQFMAPEQRAGDHVGPEADQYALGRTLLEMLVGGRVSIDRDAAVAELPAELPAELRAAIERATAIDPDRRFGSMTELADALAAVELGELAPPRRLAPLARDASPFAWLSAAHTAGDDGPELVRADFRLRELAAAGVLPAADVDDLLARGGLTDLGFAVWGARARLGAITSADALARASDVVILLHGWGHSRDVWSQIARAVCRDNAQAMVIAPDLHGFGETRFDGVPTLEQARMAGLARVVDDWRRLLGVATIPTVMVGHSMAGMALLTMDDDSAGVHVARIAISPVIPAYEPSLRKRFRRQARLAATLGRFGPIRRLTISVMARRQKDSRHLIPEINRLAAAQTAALPGRVIQRLARGVGDERPSPGPHRRLAVVTGVGDPLMSPAGFARALDALGVEPTQRIEMPDAGHYPHVEIHAHPELSARNAHELTRLIDSMLVTAGEISGSGSDEKIAFGSTLPASSSTR